MVAVQVSVATFHLDTMAQSGTKCSALTPPIQRNNIFREAISHRHVHFSHTVQGIIGAYEVKSYLPYYRPFSGTPLGVLLTQTDQTVIKGG